MTGRVPPTAVTVAFVASAEQMGQQQYESQLIAALTARDAIAIRARGIRSMRSRGGSGPRVSLNVAARLPFWMQPILARRAYGRGALVHRLDARLPAASSDVLTIHDVAPLVFEDEGPWPRHATLSARRAAAVIVPSQASEREVRTKLGVARVHVIPPGVDPACWHAAPLTRDDRQRLGGVDQYIVYAGGSSERKNLRVLAESWQRTAEHTPDFDLLICGPDSVTKQRLFGDLPRCRLLGMVDRDLLLRLLRDSIAVVVPSTYEGFGLPVLEAMAAGTVVVASRASALPEVAGDAALLVDPTADGLAAGIAAARACGRERRVDAGRRWAERFSWAETARRHVELYCAVWGNCPTTVKI